MRTVPSTILLALAAFFLRFTGINAQANRCDLCPGGNLLNFAEVDISEANCLAFGSEDLCAFLVDFNGESCQALAETDLFIIEECPIVRDVSSFSCCNDKSDRREFIAFLSGLITFFRSVLNNPNGN